MFLGGNDLNFEEDFNDTINVSRWIQNREIELSAWVKDMSFFE